MKIKTNELVHVFVNGEEIITTPSHPFYVPKLGWTSAIKLRAGDILVLLNGELVIVEQVQHEILESPVKVYNFDVEDFHTYFVGENSVLVHNKCDDKILTRKEALKKIRDDLGITKSQQPEFQRMVYLEDQFGNHVIYEGKMIQSREMIYKVNGKFYGAGNPISRVVIQDHSYGHKYLGGIGNQPSHFNVRLDNNVKTGSVRGIQSKRQINLIFQ